MFQELGIEPNEFITFVFRVLTHLGLLVHQPSSEYFSNVVRSMSKKKNREIRLEARARLVLNYNLKFA